MALPSTGPISLNDVNVELGNAATALISLNDAAVRALAEVPTGTISMEDLRGKAAASHTVTEGYTSSVSKTGFGVTVGFISDVTTLGSINPTTLSSVALTAVFFNGQNSVDEPPAAGNFVVRMSGNRAQSFFTSVEPQDAVVLATSDATRSYDSTNDRTQWLWVGVTWPARWDGTGTSTVNFIV